MLLATREALYDTLKSTRVCFAHHKCINPPPLLTIFFLGIRMRGLVPYPPTGVPLAVSGRTARMVRCWGLGQALRREKQTRKEMTKTIDQKQKKSSLSQKGRRKEGAKLNPFRVPATRQPPTQLIDYAYSNEKVALFKFSPCAERPKQQTT